MTSTPNRWETYLPQDRRASLRRGTPLPDPAFGAALLADISGFTPLTRSLADALGPRRGAEELILRINQVYETLIAEVERWGGSVIDFAGDAMLCWFGAGPTAGGDLTPALLAAVAAGLAMQTSMRHFANVAVAGGGQVALSLKAAITTGQARRFVAGDPDIQLLDVLAGAPLDRLGQVAGLATGGQVVVDGTAVRANGQSLVFEPAADDTVLVTGTRVPVPEAPRLAEPIDPGASTDETLRSWIPRQIQPRLAQGQEAYLAELRPAVAMFIQFEGLDYADTGAGARLDALIRWVQARATAWDGLLLQITTGDKGTYLYVVFGAPVAHEDDAIRAVHAALDIRALPDELAWARGLRFGITRGVMRTGTYGGPTRRAYGVMGNEVNVAARLMLRAAAGQILASAPVVAELRGRFAERALEPMVLKGLATPLAVHEILERAAEAAVTTGEWARTGAIVGRVQERARLRAHLEALAQGNGSLAVIVGEPGIGKSHLLGSTIRDAQAAGTAALLGAGSTLERATLYLAWRPIFARLLRLADAPADPVERAQFLRAQLAPEEQEQVALLGAVVPFVIPDTEATAVLGAQVRAETTRALLARILERFTGRAPLLLAIEDAQWLDSASWALIQRVAAGGKVFLLFTSRPIVPGTTPELEQLLAAPGVDRLDLGALDSADALQLVRERLGVRSLPDEVAALIRQRAEGNPFFSEELGYALRDSGVLLVSDGDCRLAANARLEALALPGNVEGVVHSRIDRLPPSQQLAVKVASVIGRAFAYRILHDVHPVATDTPRLRDDLSALARLDLTPLEAEHPELSYVFRHAITREVAYNLMLFAQRQSLHRAVAEWYERSYPDDLSRFYPLLAAHWTQVASDPGASAETIRTAIARVHLATEQAIRSYANSEATKHLGTELELLARLPAGAERDQQELGLQTMLAYCHMTLAGFGAPLVEQTYRRANELAVDATASVQLGFILYGLFSFYASRAEYPQATALAERLMEVGRAVNDSPTLTVGYQSAGIAAFCRGDLSASLEALRESTRLAGTLADTALFGYGGDFQVFTGAWIALAEQLSGLPLSARATYEAALARSPNEHFGRAFVLSFAPVPVLRRDPVETIRRAAEVGELAGKYGFFLNGVQGRLFQGWALAEQGDPAGGLELMAGSLPILRFVKLDSFLPWYLTLYAQAQADAGDTASALATLDEAWQAAEAAGGSFASAEVRRLQGELRAERTLLDEAWAIAIRQGQRWWQLRIATSLLRHTTPATKPADRARVKEIVDSLPEARDTRDWADAMALLN